MFNIVLHNWQIVQHIHVLHWIMGLQKTDSRANEGSSPITSRSFSTTLLTFFSNGCQAKTAAAYHLCAAALSDHKPPANLWHNIICTSEHLFNSQPHSQGLEKSDTEGWGKYFCWYKLKDLGTKHFAWDVRMWYFHKLAYRISLRGGKKGFDFERSHPAVVHIFNNSHLQISICYTEYKYFITLNVSGNKFFSWM